MHKHVSRSCQRVRWNETHVLQILQYIKQSYVGTLHQPSSMVSNLYRSLRSDPVLSVYSQMCLKMKLFQIKRAIRRYLSGAPSGMITKRIYFDLALEIYGKGQKVNCQRNMVVEKNLKHSKQSKVRENGLCRCCRSPQIVGGVDLFDDCYEGQNYAAILMSLLFLELPKLDNVSTKVCARCAKFIENIKVFSHQCQESNEMFRSRFTVMESAADGKASNSMEDDFVPQIETDSESETEESICVESKETILDSNDFKTEPDDPNMDSNSLADTTETNVKSQNFDCENDDHVESEDEQVPCSNKANNSEIRKGRSGRGPSWNESHLNTFLLIAKNYMGPNGKFNYSELQKALAEIPELSHYSTSAVKSKLFAIKQRVHEPGMPKIKDRIFTRAALSLFGNANEDSEPEFEDSICFESKDTIFDSNDFKTDPDDQNMDSTSLADTIKTNVKDQSLVYLDLNCENGDHGESEDEQVPCSNKANNSEIRKRRSGRGPSWNESHLNTFLLIAKNYMGPNGKFNYSELQKALAKIPELSHYSPSAVKSKLFAIKQRVQEPGMPKIKDKIFINAALSLFAHANEDDAEANEDEMEDKLAEVQEPVFLEVPCKNEDVYETEYETDIQRPKHSSNHKRGPAYPPATVKKLLTLAINFQHPDGFVNYYRLHAALRCTNLQHLSLPGIKSKLYAIKREVLQPGMPKIIHQVYADAAIKLFGSKKTKSDNSS
ncbi:uncharacterized protein LOC131694029 [Topomyia yanbarensis]|uniref:uncharacterized protein LOC131694029 n=1 Tax=Topomyia yanbarensis TaxID=2498891 RepID=UPI00273CEBC9|nr:uncharacterized protein LOC131694029 [Topomyia yanbarensis]